MSANANGKAPRRPRTTSHVPQDGSTGRETKRESSGAVGRSGDALGGQDEATVRDGPYRADGRGLRGHFAPGNKLASGNPNAKRQHELRQVFLQAIEPAMVIALAKRLQVEALRGDMDCMKLVLDHAIGRASQAVSLSGPDGSPLGMNFSAVTAIVLNALAGDPDKRLEVAQRLMELDDARDIDT